MEILGASKDHRCILGDLGSISSNLTCSQDDPEMLQPLKNQWFERSKRFTMPRSVPNMHWVIQSTSKYTKMAPECPKCPQEVPTYLLQNRMSHAKRSFLSCSNFSMFQKRAFRVRRLAKTGSERSKKNTSAVMDVSRDDIYFLNEPINYCKFL